MMTFVFGLFAAVVLAAVVVVLCFAAQNAKKFPINIIGGIVFALFALRTVFNMCLYRGVPFSVWSFLWIAIYAGIAVSLFLQRRSLLCAGFAGLSVFQISAMLRNYRIEYYMVEKTYFSFGKIQYNTSFSPITMTPDICELISYIIVTVMIIMVIRNKKSNEIRKFWFAPAIIYLFSPVFTTIIWIGQGSIGYWYNGLGNAGILNTYIYPILQAAGILFSMMWIAYPDGMRKKTASYYTDGMENLDFSDGAGYISMAKHVILLFFTFGIWYLVWIYKTTEFLNGMKKEEHRNPATKLLLCMFVPFYIVYWTYKSALRVDKMAREKGVSSELATPCLILAIFIGIIPPILIQDKINAVVTSKASALQNTSNMQSMTNMHDVRQTSSADELLKFKELLDNGAITQEEYDAKKKQLLEL